MIAFEVAEGLGVAITGALVVIWFVLAVLRRLNIDLNALLEPPPQPPPMPSYARVPLAELVSRANASFGMPVAGSRPDLSFRPVREES